MCVTAVGVRRVSPRRITDSDGVLMLRVRRGDGDAFRCLFDRYHKDIVNFYYWRQRKPDMHLAEEYAQEVFLRVWESRRNYKLTGRFRSYLFSIAINLWRDRMRKKELSCVFVSVDRPRTGQDGEPIRLEIHDRKAADLRDVVMRNENNGRIEKALRSLSSEQREVIMLRFFEGFSYREISDLIHCPVGTVCSRRNLALQRLARELRALRGKTPEAGNASATHTHMRRRSAGVQRE